MQYSPELTQHLKGETELDETQIIEDLYQILALNCPGYSQTISMECLGLQEDFTIPDVQSVRVFRSLAFFSPCLRNFCFEEFITILCAMLFEYPLVFVSDSLQKLSSTM